MRTFIKIIVPNLMKKILLTLCCYIIAFFAFAQNQAPSLMNVIPPSPTAAALGKYGEIPVSLYTGVPNISIPLYEINEGDIKLPISLSYHASGIKVEEIASNVGLGWSLNAGGVITRTVRGLPDESPLGYVRAKMGRKLEDYRSGVLNDIEMVNFEKMIVQGKIDVEPDVFNINALGISGKMVLDIDGNPILMPDQKLKVEILGGVHIFGFKITDNNSTVFMFTETEQANTESSCNDNPGNMTTTAYYLTSIKTLKGNEITLSYTTSSNIQELMASETYTISDVYLNSLNGANCNSEEHNSCGMFYQYDVKILSEINTLSTKVVFNYDFPRQDLNESSANTKIIIYNKSLNNEIIKQIIFDYDYYTTNSINIALKLVGIKEIDKNNNLLAPPYLFEYNTESIPERNSKAQDHWGYYNAKPNITLVPKMLYSFPTLNGIRTIEWDGADRSVNKETTKNGILTKISYPTGGYSLFEYENNTYGFNKQILVNQPDTSYAQNEGVLVSNAVDVAVKRFREKNFSLNAQQFVKIQYSRFCTKRVYNNELLEPEGIVRIVNISTNQVVFEGTENVRGLVTIITLNAGNYKLYVEVNNAGDHASLSISYEPNIIFLKSLLTSGLRIKKIIDDDGLGNKKEKTYSYNMENEADRSSGVLVRNPKYDYKFSKNVVNRNNIIVPCSFIIRTAHSQLPLVTNAGYHVAYRQVTIIEKGTKNNGKTVTTFVSPFEFGDRGGEGFPFAPPTSYEHKRGNVAKEVSYKFDMNLAQYIPITEKTYKYKYGINTQKVNGMKMGIIADNSIRSGIGTQIQYQILKSLYQYISEFMHLETTTEKIYAQTDNPAYMTSTNISDYSSKHYQPIKTIQQDSKGREHISYFKYVMDYEFCSNTCETTYNTAIDNCYNTFHSSIHKCQTDYDECYLLGGDVNYCQNAKDSCLRNSNTSLPICQNTAFNEYNTCKTDYLNCLVANRNNAQDKQTAAILQMQLNNQISVPIEQWTTIKGSDGIEKVTSAMVYEYERHPQNGNLVVQKGIQVLEINKPLANFQPSRVENLVFKTHTDIEGNAYVKRINFDTFDDKGNLLQQNKTDDISQAYIWGYNKTIPIAQVINANKDDIFYTSFEEETTGGIIIDNEPQAKTGRKYFNGTYQVPNVTTTVVGKKYTLTYFQFENNEWKYKKMPYTVNMSLTGMIDEVRIYPEGALMTTATYEPLIGKTSETDANGITTYYEYDSANHLKFIKDQDKNIIQRFTYKYAE